MVMSVRKTHVFLRGLNHSRARPPRPRIASDQFRIRKRTRTKLPVSFVPPLRLRNVGLRQSISNRKILRHRRSGSIFHHRLELKIKTVKLGGEREQRKKS